MGLNIKNQAEPRIHKDEHGFFERMTEGGAGSWELGELRVERKALRRFDFYWLIDISAKWA